MVNKMNKRMDCRMFFPSEKEVANICLRGAEMLVIIFLKAEKAK